MMPRTFDESKVHRGQPDNAGKFGPGGGGTKSKANQNKRRGVGHEHARPTKAITAKQAASEGPPLKLKIVKGQRAFTGKQVETEVRYGKSDTGNIAENIIISYYRMSGRKDARRLNLDRNNYPIDLIQDHESVEAKGGQVGNGPKAQQWRLTIGEPGVKEKAEIAAMSPEKKAAYNAIKQKKIRERKKKALAALTKLLGHPVRPATVTCIINPDTKMADIYHFSGWHDRIGWNSPEAQKAYVCTVRYE